jgi:acyl dehydratase
MTIARYEDVEFGDDLPTFDPDTGMENVRRFAKAAQMMAARFTDHEGAKKEGLPGAMVPGVMSQAILAAMIHRWAPDADIVKIDTIFRAPVMVDQRHHVNGVVTDLDEAARTAEVDLTVTNDAGETRVLGTATVKLP